MEIKMSWLAAVCYGTKDLEPAPGNRSIGGIDKEKIAQLAESIKAVGIQVPLIIRDNPRRGEKGAAFYEIIAGERRWRAAKAIGLETVPCIQRNVDDATAAKIRTIENLQREDVHPLDEAEGFLRLTKAGHDVDLLAKELGKSAAYIYQRMKLPNLVPELKKSLIAGELGTGQAVLIARLTPDQQRDVIKEYPYQNIKELTVRELDEHIRENVMMSLSRAAFKKGDAELVPKAGSCEACKKRTGSQQALFSDLVTGRNDFCLDAACYNAKLDAQVVRCKEELKGKPHLLVLSGYSNKVPDGVLRGFDWDECKPGTKGAVRVLIVDGPGRGRMTWGTKNSNAESGRNIQNRDKADRLKRKIKELARIAVYRLVVEGIEKSGDEKTDAELCRIAAQWAWGRVDHRFRVKFAKLEGWKNPEKDAAFLKESRGKTTKIPAYEFMRFMLKLAIAGDTDVYEYWSGDGKALEAAARALGINMKAEEAKAAAEARKAEAKKAKVATKKKEKA